jgi:hypothetical protein
VDLVESDPEVKQHNAVTAGILARLKTIAEPTNGWGVVAETFNQQPRQALVIRSCKTGTVDAFPLENDKPLLSLLAELRFAEYSRIGEKHYR